MLITFTTPKGRHVALQLVYGSENSWALYEVLVIGGDIMRVRLYREG